MTIPRNRRILQNLLTHWWFRYDQAAGQTVYDAVARNTAVLNGTSSVSSGELVCDGGSSSRMTTTSSTGNNLYAISFWVYTPNAYSGDETTANRGAVLAKFGSVYPFVFFGASSSGLTGETLALHTASGQVSYIKASISIGWHHVVFNYNGSQHDIYLDGALPTQYTQGGGAALFADTSLEWGGRSNNNQYYIGKLANIRYYFNAPLTLPEIQALNKAGRF